MEFHWSEAKRAANLKAHGLDFVDAALVFEGVTYTFEDDRFSCGEQRFVTSSRSVCLPAFPFLKSTLGRPELTCTPSGGGLGAARTWGRSVVHTESENEIRVISFRKATKRKAQIYFNEIQD